MKRGQNKYYSLVIEHFLNNKTVLYHLIFTYKKCDTITDSYVCSLISVLSYQKIL